MRPFILSILLCGVSLWSSHGLAQTKWWWESYPAQVDKTLSLKGASGGSVAAVQNQTGSSVNAANSAATQPPTVIIQQTSSVTAAAGTGMTCTPASYGVGTSSSYGSFYYSSTCPAIPGYSSHAITAANYGISYGPGNTVVSCCYVKSETALAGAASYAPWTGNPAFNSNGYAGSQHQAYVTAGGYTFTVPDGVYRIWITAVGGGGSGWAGMWSLTDQYGGGAGGIAYRLPLDVLPDQVFSVIVGYGASQSYNYTAPSGGGASYVLLSGSATNGVGAQGGSGGGSSQVGYTEMPGGCPPGGTCWTGGNWAGGQGSAGYLSVLNASTSGKGGSPGQFGGGNSYNPSGGGRGHSASGAACGGGGAGFIGMPYTTTTVPRGGGGTVSQGGFGFGAGGAGTCAATSGGRGADGAVWIEW